MAVAVGGGRCRHLLLLQLLQLLYLLLLLLLLMLDGVLLHGQARLKLLDGELHVLELHVVDAATFDRFLLAQLGCHGGKTQGADGGLQRCTHTPK